MTTLAQSDTTRQSALIPMITIGILFFIFGFITWLQI